jgi:hypothetical protein
MVDLLALNTYNVLFWLTCLQKQSLGGAHHWGSRVEGLEQEAGGAFMSVLAILFKRLGIPPHSL